MLPPYIEISLIKIELINQIINQCYKTYFSD